MFDLSYLSMIPNMIVAAPSDEKEMRDMLYSATIWDKPAAVRYPRGQVIGVEVPDEFSEIEIGKAVVQREGEDITIMAIGNMVHPAIEAAWKLNDDGISAEVINLRFAKPLDKDLIINSGTVFLEGSTVIKGTISGSGNLVDNRRSTGGSEYLALGTFVPLMPFTTNGDYDPFTLVADIILNTTSITVGKYRIVKIIKSTDQSFMIY